MRTQSLIACRQRLFSHSLLFVLMLLLLAAFTPSAHAQSFPLSIIKTGTGLGTVAGGPINCGATCSATTSGIVTLTATPTTGSTFTGWSGACSGTGPCTVAMTAARTVTANFNLLQYTVTVANPGGGTITSNVGGINCGTGGSVCSATLNHGVTVILSAAVAPGSTAPAAFGGFSGACNGTGTCLFTMDGPKTVTAVFNHPITVATTGTGTGTVTKSPDATVYPFGASVVLTANPTVSSNFTSWTGCTSVAGNQCTRGVGVGTTVTASFALKKVSLTVGVMGQGDVEAASGANIACPGTCTDNQINYGTTVSLTAIPQDGYYFNRWVGDCSGNGSSCTLSMTGNKGVTAEFMPLALAVINPGNGTVTSSVGGINCGPQGTGTCSTAFLVPTTVTLTATPFGIASLGTWTGANCAPGTSTCTVTVSQAMTVAHQFRAGVFIANNSPTLVSLTSIPAGLNCPGTCVTNFPASEVVSLVMAPLPSGYTVSVSANVSGLTSNADKTLVQFTPSPTAAQTVVGYDVSTALTVNQNGTGTGQLRSQLGNQSASVCAAPSCVYTATVGTRSWTITPMPDPGSEFVGWSGACTGTGACTVTHNQPNVVTATFNRKTVALQTNIVGGGRVSSNPVGVNCDNVASCTNNLPAGVYVLTAQANTGFVFAGWSGPGCGGTGTCAMVLTDNRSMTATFTAVPGANFVLSIGKFGGGQGTVSSNTGGINCGSTCATSFPAGTVVTLTASAAPGSRFSRWSGVAGCGTAPTCTVTLNSLTTPSAEFFLNTTPVTLTASSANVTQGESVTLTARFQFSSGDLFPSGSFTFNDGTSVLCGNVALAFGSFESTCTTVLPVGTRSITATYAGDMSRPNTTTAPVTVTVGSAAPTELALNVAKTGTGQGTVTSNPAGIDCGNACSSSFTTGATVTLTAMPAMGSVFDGWTGACSGTVTCTVTMDAARSVTAAFRSAGTLTAAQVVAVVTVIPAATPPLVRQSYQIAIRVTGTGAGAGTPTGTVSVTTGFINTPVCMNLPLIAGNAVCNAETRPEGNTYQIAYSGDATFAPGENRLVMAPAVPDSPVFVASANVVDFGALDLGSATVTRSITISNTALPVGTTSIGFSANDAPAPFVHRFSLGSPRVGTTPAPNETCQTAGLLNGASCTINIDFSPRPGFTGRQTYTLTLTHATTSVALATITVTAFIRNDVFADTRVFVMQQYRDFLNREGDAGGIGFWTGEIDAGRQSRTTMVEQFLTSGEFAQTVAPIVRLYFATYQRLPDSGGLKYWAGELQRGVAFNTIAETFATAPEFVARYGSLSGAAFVERLYQNILGRPGEADGVAFWTGELASGRITRGVLLAQFASSNEYVAGTQSDVAVVMTYVALLARAPEQSGFDFWVAEVDRGRSIRDLIGAFLAASEYRGRFVIN
jgi:hypothetical protein